MRLSAQEFRSDYAAADGPDQFSFLPHLAERGKMVNKEADCHARASTRLAAKLGS